jgi:lipopolysaccharide biosynthesis regulator YciM
MVQYVGAGQPSPVPDHDLGGSMSHIHALAAMRADMRSRDYARAVRTGRAELEIGRESSELLVLLAMAAQLCEPQDGVTNDDVRFWLERAADSDVRNVDARLELGHFLDAVGDEPDHAVDAFAAALDQAVEFVEAAMDGLASAAETAEDDTVERVRELREGAMSRLSGLAVR